MSAAYPSPATVDGWQRAQRYARYLWQLAVAPRKKLLRDAGLSKAQGLRELHGNLLIPMRDPLGELWAVQEMPTGFRPGKPMPGPGTGPTFLLGARLDGMRYAAGILADSDFAGRVIGVTVHVHDALLWNGETGATVLVAFAIENVATLAAELRFAYPSARVALWSSCEEHDADMQAAAARTGTHVAMANEGIDSFDDTP